MDKMKDSGIEWIGDSPIDWNKFTIGQLFEQVKQKNTGLIEKNLLSLSYGQIKRKDINSGNGLLPESFEGYNIIEKDDIVLRMTDLQNDKTSLRQGIAEERGIITAAYITMRAIHKVSPRFVYYQLYGFDVSKGYYGMGSGVRQGVNWKDIKKLSLILPNLELQNEIAKFLDEKTALIDDIITDTKQTIEKLKSYKKSLITEIVTNGIKKDVKMVPTEIDWIDEIPEGWEVAKIKNISKLRNEKTSYERGQNFLALEKMVSYKPGYIDLLTEVENGRQQVIKQGDIVFSKLRPYLAKVALADFDGHGTGELLVFNDIKINRKLFMYKLISEQILQPVRGASYGVKMPRANPDFILSLPISFPISLSEQSEIVNYLDQKASQIDTLIIEKENLISEYENYKKSLIYEYVTGKKRYRRRGFELVWKIMKNDLKKILKLG